MLIELANCRRVMGEVLITLRTPMLVCERLWAEADRQRMYPFAPEADISRTEAMALLRDVQRSRNGENNSSLRLLGPV